MPHLAPTRFDGRTMKTSPEEEESTRGRGGRGTQSGCTMVHECCNLPEIMSVCVSASKINIISGILWPLAAYLWPGFCAGGANNASKKPAEREPSSAQALSPALSVLQALQALHQTFSVLASLPVNCIPIVPM